MLRGRQYYDPIVQVPGMVEGEGDMSRIEVFQDEGLKWWGRQVASDGSLTGNRVGDFSHDGLLKAVREAWPTHPIYELRNEGEDSTWEGHGPSPRIFQQQHDAIKNFVPDEQHDTAIGMLIEQMQNSSPETGASGVPAPPVDSQHGPSSDVGASGAGDEQLPPPVPLHLLRAPKDGVYLLLSDVCAQLELWAVAYEVEKNPSGALALREAVDALKEVG